MKIKVLFIVIAVSVVCSACVRQKKVEVTQTFRVENRTNDTWLMTEKVIWGGDEAVSDSAEIEISPLQSDSISHYFRLWKGGAIFPAIVPPVTVDIKYERDPFGCEITTRLLNKRTQEVYEWKQRLRPLNIPGQDNPDSPQWVYEGEDGPFGYNAYHLYKCVISPELFGSK